MSKATSPSLHEKLVDYIASNPSFLGTHYLFHDRSLRVEGGTIDIILRRSDRPDVFCIVEVKTERAGRKELGQLLGYIADYAHLNKLSRDQWEGILVATDFRSDVRRLSNVIPIQCVQLNPETFSLNVQEPKRRSYPPKLAEKTYLRDRLETLVMNLHWHVISEVERKDLGGAYEVLKDLQSFLEMDIGTQNAITDFLTAKMMGIEHQDIDRLKTALKCAKIRKLTI